MAVIDPNDDGASPHMEGPTITRQGVEARIKDLLAAGVKERYEGKGWPGGRRGGRSRREGGRGRKARSPSSRLGKQGEGASGGGCVRKGGR